MLHTVAVDVSYVGNKERDNVALYWWTNFKSFKSEVLYTCMLVQCMYLIDKTYVQQKTAVKVVGHWFAHMTY